MRSLVSLILASVVFGACAAAPTPKPYVDIAKATLVAADPIPSPTTEVVLTVTGAVSKAADGEPLPLDLATIERMGLVRYVVHDPWLDEDLEFTGVLLSVFTDVVGASPDATSLHMRAIDDYEVELPLADVRRWPILLVTQTNGAPMGIEDKGPTRIVFPYDQFPEIDQLAYKDYWIWQLSTIEVR